jgi:predicted Zn finger-like uncharacterized protein
MSIATTCPHCGKSYNLDDSHAGKKARCKQCKNIFQIPGEGATIITPAPARAAAAAAAAPAPAQPPPARATPTERTEGGIPVYRHPSERGGAAPPPPPAGEPLATPYMEQIALHIEQTIGVSPMIFHEKVSEGIKLDLFIVPPTNQPPSEEHPLGTNHFTVITAGLSAKPQAVPEDARSDISPLQELMIALPGDWPGMKPDGTFDKNVINDDKHWWPFAFLKMVARMPAEYETFLAPGVTIPNGEEAAPFADNTKFGCMMAFMPMLSPNSAQLQIDDNTRIDFYALWPLYPEEMQLKLDKGLEPLLKKLMEAEVSELIAIDRGNLCKKKGWFGRG